MVDFWEGMLPEDKNRYLSLFSEDYTVVEELDNPDLIIYSCFGLKHLDYGHCKRLFISGENVVPDFNVCDFALSTVKLQYDNRCLWVPEAFYSCPTPVVASLDLSSALFSRKFCSFIYNNETSGSGALLRKQFCKKLMSDYKMVDCPGKVLHNMQSDILSHRYDLQEWHSSKIKFLNQYKFNIAFENSFAPGYITEKLVDCYRANTVPIYWGSGGDVAPYPKKSMICANDYDSLDSLIAYIKKVDEDDDLYAEILKANPFRPENIEAVHDFRPVIRNFIKSVVERNDHKDYAVSPYSDAYRCYLYAIESRKIHIRMAIALKKVCSKLLFLSPLKKLYQRFRSH